MRWGCFLEGQIDLAKNDEAGRAEHARDDQQ